MNKVLSKMGKLVSKAATRKPPQAKKGESRTPTGGMRWVCLKTSKKWGGQAVVVGEIRALRQRDHVGPVGHDARS